MLLTGSEDGRLVGWDLMSQKVILNKQMSAVPADNQTSSSNGLICSVDYMKEKDLLATSGPAFKGVKIHRMTDMIER